MPPAYVSADEFDTCAMTDSTWAGTDAEQIKHTSRRRKPRRNVTNSSKKAKKITKRTKELEYKAQNIKFYAFSVRTASISKGNPLFTGKQFDADSSCCGCKNNKFRSLHEIFAYF